MKITTTETTTKEIQVDYEFMVQAVEDGAVTFTRKYGSAIEAVRAYESFKDFGFAKYEREVILLEADGQVHSKRFVGPLGRLPVS